MSRKIIFQGGTTLKDYKHINKKKMRAFLDWRKQTNIEWNRLSSEEQAEWGKKQSMKNNKQAHINTKLRQKVIERDNSICRYCGLFLGTENKIHIDHIHPFSKGGETVIENLATACSNCNKTKSFLHGISPLSLETISQIDKDKPRNTLESSQRQKRLFKEWKKMKQDRKQYNLEAEYFFYLFDKIEAKNNIAFLEKLLPAKDISDIDRVYDTAGWIAKYLLNKE